jgi:hypothetical protein
VHSRCATTRAKKFRSSQKALSNIVVSFQQKCDWIAKISEEKLQDPQNAFVSVPYVAEENDWYNLNLWTTPQTTN